LELFRTSDINVVEYVAICFALNHPCVTLENRRKKFMDKYAIL